MSQVNGRRIWPRAALSWTGIALGIVALASWVVFPFITIAYRATYPVVDTWVMPAIATTLVDGAAILNMLVVSLRRERSMLNIAMVVITTLAGLFFTLLVVGEAVGSP